MSNQNGAGASAAVVVHHVAGRVRIRVETARRNPARLEQIRDSIANIEGVHNVSANVALGTLTVHYEPGLFTKLIQRLREQGSKMDLFSLSDQKADVTPPVTHVDRALDNFVSRVNSGLGMLTGETVNLKELFPFSILLYSVFFVDKAIAASQWLSWVQFAFSTYLELHQEEPIAKVSKSVDALRDEVRQLRQELLGSLKKGAGQ